MSKYKFKNGSTIQCIPSKDIVRPTKSNIEFEDVWKIKDLPLEDFVTDILGLELLPHQKQILKIIEKYPKSDPGMWFHRGDAQSRYIFGWLYKWMWQEYCKTGDFRFFLDTKDNNTNFDREYEYKWEVQDE